MRKNRKIRTNVQELRKKWKRKLWYNTGTTVHNHCGEEKGGKCVRKKMSK